VHETLVLSVEVGSEIVASSRNVFKCKLECDPHIATKTSNGIAFEIAPTLLVATSCDQWSSPLGMIEHSLKFTLETIKGNADLTKTVPLDVYQARAKADISQQWYPTALLYKPSEDEFQHPLSTLAFDGVTSSTEMVQAKPFQEVSCVPSPSGWTLSYPTDPEAASAKDITFPDSAYLHAIKYRGRVVAQHDPAPIPSVSVFHFGEITPGYPARKPLPSSAQFSSSEKKKKKKNKKNKTTNKKKNKKIKKGKKKDKQKVKD
jgi:hypothetical protein